jgi:hypothetical protein
VRITLEITSAALGAKNKTQILDGVWLIDGLYIIEVKT